MKRYITILLGGGMICAICSFWNVNSSVSFSNSPVGDNWGRVTVNQTVYREVYPTRAVVERKGKTVASRSSSYRTYQSTAYTWTGHRTASGAWPKEGRTIAVNPAKFKLGQRVYIKGLGWRIAEDIIPPESIAKGAQIDIYMGRGPGAEREAREHGRRNVMVYGAVATEAKTITTP